MKRKLCWVCSKHPVGDSEFGICPGCNMVTGLALLDPKYCDGAAVVIAGMTAYAAAPGDHVAKSQAANAKVAEASSRPATEVFV